MMERVLTDDVLRDRLVAEASEHVLRFDWADVARRTAEVYADLARRGSARGCSRAASAGEPRRTARSARVTPAVPRRKPGFLRARARRL